MANTVKLELTKEEFLHLENDLIHYIWHLKEHIFGDAWSFGCWLSEEEKALLTPEREMKLRDYGYYSRLALYEKMRKFEEENFSFSECGE